MPRIERAHVREVAGQDVERGQPAAGMTVRGVRMHAVEGEVTGEGDRSAAVRGHDDVTVRVALGRAHVVDGEAQLVDRHARPADQQRVGVEGLGRPFPAVHRGPLGPFRRGDLGDHPAHVGRGVDRNFAVAHQGEHAVEVIRVRVRHEDRAQRLVQRLQPGPERRDVGDQQVGVHHHDALLALDEIGVDEQPGFGRPVGVYDRSGHVLPPWLCRAERRDHARSDIWIIDGDGRRVQDKL